MIRLKKTLAFVMACALVLIAFGSTASAADKSTGGAADFPPGAFSDGGRYSVADFKGKVLVLFFYEQDCPRCRGLIPERSKVVKEFKDKPVRFIAVAAGDPLVDAMSYVHDTKLAMPVYADALGLMEHRYGQKISLQNIYQFRIIGPSGDIVGQSMEPADIDRALAGVKWKYKDDKYDTKLTQAVDLLEWNQYESGMKTLRPWLKKTGAVGESAKKLYDVIKVEGEQWNTEAAAAVDSEPTKAFELYSRIANCFPDEEMGKKAAEEVKKLKLDKKVKEELAARKAYETIYAGMAKATIKNKPDIAAQAQSIAKKYKETETGEKAKALAEEIAGS